MAKYYTWSKTNKLVVQCTYAVHAATTLYHTFRGKEFGKYIFVSEVGFNRNSGHPGHIQDCKFTFSYIDKVCNFCEPTDDGIDTDTME